VTQADWAKLMQTLGVKGVHVAERDTQISANPKPVGVFVNTWSVDGLLSEGYQPAELGWGTHEKKLPPHGHAFDHGPGYAIWIDRPGADTRVRSWVPAVGAQFAFLVTHNEAISISDYYTVRDGRKVTYRPTCHYAYHPSNDAVLSLHEMFGSGRKQSTLHILREDEILDGGDELGVLIYGHKKNAYWYGSRLQMDEARKLAPYQNATGLQVTSAVLAGMVWAMENPNAGIVETDEMDFRRCLELQRPYLGPVSGVYTDWNPLKDRNGLFDEKLDKRDPWQFSNMIAS
jgi:homospermidine synthase